MREIREAPVPVRWAWRLPEEPVDMCRRSSWSIPIDKKRGFRKWEDLRGVSADWTLSVLLSNDQIVIVRAKK